MTHPEAGYGTRLPGERSITTGQRMERGGHPAANTELGKLAWRWILEALNLAAPTRPAECSD